MIHRRSSRKNLGEREKPKDFSVGPTGGGVLCRMCTLASTHDRQLLKGDRSGIEKSMQLPCCLPVFCLSHASCSSVESTSPPCHVPQTPHPSPSEVSKNERGNSW